MELDIFLNKLCTFEDPDNLLIFINESLEKKRYYFNAATNNNMLSNCLCCK